MLAICLCILQAGTVCTACGGTLVAMLALVPVPFLLHAVHALLCQHRKSGRALSQVTGARNCIEKAVSCWLHACCCCCWPAAQVQPEDVFMRASEFKAKFIDPITEGQKPTATRWQRVKMARQLSVLQDRTAVSVVAVCAVRQASTPGW